MDPGGVSSVGCCRYGELYDRLCLLVGRGAAAAVFFCAVFGSAVCFSSARSLGREGATLFSPRGGFSHSHAECICGFVILDPQE